MSKNAHMNPSGIPVPWSGRGWVISGSVRRRKDGKWSLQEGTLAWFRERPEAVAYFEAKSKSGVPCRLVRKERT